MSIYQTLDHDELTPSQNPLEQMPSGAGEYFDASLMNMMFTSHTGSVGAAKRQVFGAKGVEDQAWKQDAMLVTMTRNALDPDNTRDYIDLYYTPGGILDKIQEKYPDFTPALNREDLKTETGNYIKGVQENMRGVQQFSSVSGAGQFGLGLGAGVIVAATDPLNYGASALTGIKAAVKPTLARSVRQGAVSNMAVEAVLQSRLDAELSAVGVQREEGETLISILGAGVFGGLLSGLIHGATSMRNYRDHGGYTPEVAAPIDPKVEADIRAGIGDEAVDDLFAQVNAVADFLATPKDIFGPPVNIEPVIATIRDTLQQLNEGKIPTGIDIKDPDAFIPDAFIRDSEVLVRVVEEQRVLGRSLTPDELDVLTLNTLKDLWGARIEAATGKGGLDQASLDVLHAARDRATSSLAAADSALEKAQARYKSADLMTRGDVSIRHQEDFLDAADNLRQRKDALDEALTTRSQAQKMQEATTRVVEARQAELDAAVTRQADELAELRTLYAEEKKQLSAKILEARSKAPQPPRKDGKPRTGTPAPTKEQIAEAKAQRAELAEEFADLRAEVIADHLTAIGEARAAVGEAKKATTEANRKLSTWNKKADAETKAHAEARTKKAEEVTRLRQLRNDSPEAARQLVFSRTGRDKALARRERAAKAHNKAQESVESFEHTMQAETARDSFARGEIPPLLKDYGDTVRSHAETFNAGDAVELAGVMRDVADRFADQYLRPSTRRKPRTEREINEQVAASAERVQLEADAHAIYDAADDALFVDMDGIEKTKKEIIESLKYDPDIILSEANKVCKL